MRKTCVCGWKGTTNFSACPNCGEARPAFYHEDRYHPDYVINVGDVVRIVTMARTDAVGRVIEKTLHGRLVVRLERWQADGYKLDVACSQDELEVVDA